MTPTYSSCRLMPVLSEYAVASAGTQLCQFSNGSPCDERLAQHRVFDVVRQLAERRDAVLALFGVLDDDFVVDDRRLP